MPRGIPANGGIKLSPQDRIKAAEAAIRQLQLQKRKLDLQIQAQQLDIDAANEEVPTTQPAPAQPGK